MSRRSQASAEGVQKFSWRLERIIGEGGRERVKATCKNHPAIIGWGDSETTAMRAAQSAILNAAEKADLGTTTSVGKGQTLTPDGVAPVEDPSA